MRKGWIILLLISATSYGHMNYFRTFWHPRYHDQPLNWCDNGKKHCGNKIAKQYCQKMGYPHVAQTIKANDIGKSRYLDTNRICDNAFCNGFTMIKCGLGLLEHSQYHTHYATKKTFQYPRFDHVKIDRCLTKGKRCGRAAAYAFCSYQGYQHVKGYRFEKTVPETRTIGSDELCVGRKCQGFKSITCVR